ncbi:hypothetical protein BDZ85DRAFT_309517 [Elsinoe ampelina]|uniref:Rhodopsin domain-containing protein n=1 Tax=Elsinoe ampelina TaxID=302913 RepID=A0A6A6GHR7_9PEZI|nr:hypothetical protein BDZ85DRAFT_309517 [Elsinoe ampelina]
MFIVAVVFLALPWIALLLRLYVRTFMIKSFGWDDGLMVASMLTFTVDCALVMVIGLQPKSLAFTELDRMTIQILISCNFYLATSILFKISLAVFFLRFLQERWQRLTIIISTTLYSVLGLGFIILLNRQCGDPSSMFSSQISNHCGPWRILRPLNYTYATLNAVTDWTFVLIPIFTIRNMNMPRRARISASILLALGAVSSIVSLVRMKYIEGLNVNVSLFPSPAIAVTSCIEMGLGMTAASAATLRPLFKTWMERAKSTLQRANGTLGETMRSAVPETEKETKVSQGTFASYGVGKGMLESFVEVEDRDGVVERRQGTGGLV